MLLIEIEKSNGEIFPLLFKCQPAEITLKEYVEMRMLFEDAPPHIQELFAPVLDEESEELEMHGQNEGHYIETASITRFDTAKQTPLEWGAMEKMQWIEFIGNVVALFCYVETDKGFKRAEIADALMLPASDEMADSISALFTMLVDKIYKYQEKPISEFTHKGKKFILPQSTVDNFGNITPAANISGIEAVEALQLEHVLNGKKANGEYALKDRLYHSDLGVIAAICRLVDETGKVEQMPLDMVKRRTFIDNRVKFFADLPMTTALDVCFFFVNLSPLCKITPILADFFTMKRKILMKQRHLQ